MVSLVEVFGPQGPYLLDLIHVAGRIQIRDGTVFDEPPDENPDYDGALSLVDDLLSSLDDPERARQVDTARNAVQGAALEPTLERSEFQLHASVEAFRAATGLAARDMVGQELYVKLTGPWRAKVGELHPDDLPLEG